MGSSWWYLGFGNIFFQISTEKSKKSTLAIFGTSCFLNVFQYSIIFQPASSPPIRNPRVFHHDNNFGESTWIIPNGESWTGTEEGCGYVSKSQGFIEFWWFLFSKFSKVQILGHFVIVLTVANDIKTNIFW